MSSKMLRDDSSGPIPIPHLISLLGTTKSPHAPPPAPPTEASPDTNSGSHSGGKPDAHSGGGSQLKGPAGGVVDPSQNGDARKSSGGRRVKASPSVAMSMAGVAATDLADGGAAHSLLPIQGIPESWTYAVAKRTLDMVGAAAGLLLLSPLMALCAILIKFQDGGSVFFRQVRVGLDGEEFHLMKFRSMVVNAEQMQSELRDLNDHDDDRTFKILNDPRITRVGRFMRRMSLDELPQLWNVLSGQMSLVGPRPALPSEVAKYEPRHMMRLSVKPGLTCIWQVSGRSNLNFQRQMELDLEYIADRNILTDVKLIVRTIPAVLLGDGAA